eukprot:11231884-Alexandrium_andersonii.AAC.1
MSSEDNYEFCRALAMPFLDEVREELVAGPVLKVLVRRDPPAASDSDCAARVSQLLRQSCPCGLGMGHSGSSDRSCR